MHSISSFSKQGPLGPSSFTESVGISNSAPNRMNIFIPCISAPLPVQHSKAIGTTHMREGGSSVMIFDQSQTLLF